MKTIVIAILLLVISSCTKDRYVLAYDVKVEVMGDVSDGYSPNPSNCGRTTYIKTIKRGNSIMIDFTACRGVPVRVKVSSGKHKVWYDQTKGTHKETILIK